MKIVHFITDFRRGGESTILSNFIPWLQARGVENVLCCLTSHTGGEESPLIGNLQKLGITYYDLGVTSSTKALFALRLIKVLQKEKPDILHTYLFHANITGRIIGSMFPSISVVSSVVSSDEWKKFPHSLAEGLTSHLARKILVNAKIIKERLVQRDFVHPSKICLVYNGVDTARFEEKEAVPQNKNLRPDGFTVGWVGRFHPSKDPMTMLSAFRSFQEEYPTSTLMMVGDGELIREAKHFAREHALNVTFTGNVDSGLIHLYRKMDFLAISSKLEGIPAVVFEAAHLKVPIVSFPVGGIPEVISEKSAFLTQKHTADSLSSTLVECAKAGADEREKRSNEALHIVTKNFNVGLSYRNRLGFYLEVLGNKESLSALITEDTANTPLNSSS